MSTIEELEKAHLPAWKHNFVMDKDEIAYLTKNGVRVLIFKGMGPDEYEIKKKPWAYSWRNFKITNYYYARKTDKSHVKRFNFILNDEPFGDHTMDEMIKVLETRVNIVGRYKKLIGKLLDTHILKEDINELEVCDILGFDTKWQFADDNYFITGNDFREKVANHLSTLTNFEKSDDFDCDKAITYFRSMYHLTDMENKDYIFAYFCVAQFLYSLRKWVKLMPFLFLGGEGHTGKSTIEEFGSIKMWGNFGEAVGESIMEERARVEGLLTASTFPVFLDDQAKIQKPWLITMMKRMTTIAERVSKLKKDWKIGFDFQFCTPIMGTYNDVLSLFDDPEFRQRCLVLKVSWVNKNENWSEYFNSIPNGYIGAYIYRMTKDLTDVKLYEMFKEQDDMGLEDRAGVIAKLLQLGKKFAKDWFDLDLDISQLPVKILETLKTGNEAAVELLKTMCYEGSRFEPDDNGVLNNPRKRSWVQTEVTMLNYKKRNWKKRKKGYLITQDNIIDLSRRLGRYNDQLSLNKLYRMIKDQMRVENSNFHVPGFPGGKKGIFIPEEELSGDREKREFDKFTDYQRDELMHPDYVEVDKNNIRLEDLNPTLRWLLGYAEEDPISG